MEQHAHKKSFTKTHDTNIPRQPTFCMRNCINYTTAIEPFVLGRNIPIPPRILLQKRAILQQVAVSSSRRAGGFRPNWCSCCPQLPSSTRSLCPYIECEPVGGALTSRQAGPFRVIMGQDQPGSSCCCGVFLLFFGELYMIYSLRAFLHGVRW